MSAETEVRTSQSEALGSLRVGSQEDPRQGRRRRATASTPDIPTAGTYTPVTGMELVYDETTGGLILRPATPKKRGLRAFIDRYAPKKPGSTPRKGILGKLKELNELDDRLSKAVQAALREGRGMLREDIRELVADRRQARR